MPEILALQVLWSPFAGQGVRDEEIWWHEASSRVQLRSGPAALRMEAEIIGIGLTHQLSARLIQL